MDTVVQVIGLAVLAVAGMQLCVVAAQQVQGFYQRQALFKMTQQRLAEEITALTNKINVPGDNSNQQSWSGWRKFRLQGIQQENESIKSFYLVPHDGKPLCRFLPGQYLTVRLKIPGKSRPVIRCYSLSDSAHHTDRYRISVKKQLAPQHDTGIPDGIASAYFHDVLEIGDVIDVRAPAGNFCLDTSEREPVVLIGGGVGITPLLSMLETLAAEESPRSISLYYATLTAADRIQVKRIEELVDMLPNCSLFNVFSTPTKRDRLLMNWWGYVDSHCLRQTRAPIDADYYVCGPPPMMTAIMGELDKYGIDETRIHSEAFGPSCTNPDAAATEQTAHKGDSAVNVTFGVSDKTISWRQTDGSLLDAAETQGIPIASGCRAGHCGTCATAVLHGTVEYMEEPSFAVEKGTCLPCVAKPASELTLNA